ncbi:MAG: hypothetical protein IPH17_00070 [Bacteroidales bacterium]|nr:hypothetical protein [Bacteroidales bacterium]
MKYGVTWWGKRWLNSLNRIDYSNRLERGLSYADNGFVVYISTVANKIIAKVRAQEILLITYLSKYLNFLMSKKFY